MIHREFQNLDTGDIVRHRSSNESFVVCRHYGDRVTAVRTADITNHHEWDLTVKVSERTLIRDDGTKDITRSKE